MAQTFNGATLTFTDAASAEHSFKVRSVSESGNTRPDIDITTSADARRVVVPGLAEPTKLTFECVYDVDDTNNTRANLMALLDDCSATANGIDMKLVDDCTSPAADQFVQAAGWVTGLTFSGELDGVMMFSIEFTLDHSA